MDLLAYFPEDSLLELSKLVLTLFQKDKKILLATNNIETSHLISDFFWKLHKFVPHGINGEEFSEIQPMLIITKDNVDIIMHSNLDVLICYEFAFDDPDHLPFNTIIIWNNNGFNHQNCKIYEQKNGIWKIK